MVRRSVGRWRREERLERRSMRRENVRGERRRRETEESDDSLVVCEVVRMRLSSPASVTSYTLTVYFLPGRSSLMLTEVVVRGRSVKERNIFDN